MVKWLNGDNMVKTTLELKDEVYRKLVEASVRKYGTTKNVSKVTNEVIEEHLKEKSKESEDEEIKRRLEIAKKSAGSWKTKETGAEYVRRIRKENEKRLKRMGI